MKTPQKRVALVGINAKYIHSCLAVRSLQKAAAPRPVILQEMTINDAFDHCVAMLMDLKADVFGFSCYIWNIERVLKLAEILKKSRPGCLILLGGPEVSYDAPRVLEKNPAVDLVFCGEGEAGFKALVEALDGGCPTASLNIPGLCSREKTQAALAWTDDLDALPFAYDPADMSALSGRIIYYESMRGCPFRCSYCLSSTLAHLRFRSLEKVLAELDFFIIQGVHQVKFVDRTFNVDAKRAEEILAYLAEKDCQTNFHFEISADLLTPEILAIIEGAPKGLFQFEVGIQSTHEQTLQAITRKTATAKVADAVRRLVGAGTAHIHVDLIAGLPLEDFATFGESYDAVIALKPHMLQLGFLKLLKGTRIRAEAERYGYAFASFAPYEVISNDSLSAGELNLLRGVAMLTDRFYNSGFFKHTMDYVLGRPGHASPFAFFLAFYAYWCAGGFDAQAHALDSLFEILFRFLKLQGETDTALSLLKVDALCHNAKRLPSCFKDEAPDPAAAFELLKDEALIGGCFPELLDLTPKERRKKTGFQRFVPAVAAQLGQAGDTALFYDGGFAFFKQPADEA